MSARHEEKGGGTVLQEVKPMPPTRNQGSVAKFDFWGKIQKLGIRNSTTYRLPNSRKSNFATEPEPALLSLVNARLSGVVSPPPRAHPALSSPQDPSGLDAGFLGRANGARGHRHLWDRVDPSYARRPQPAADRPQRPLQSSLDCRGQTLSAAQSMGLDRGVGLCHRECRGQHLSMADSAG